MIIKNPLPHPMINTVRKLSRGKHDEAKYFVVEGIKLCEELFASKFHPNYIIISKDSDNTAIDRLVQQFAMQGTKVYETESWNFERLSATTTPQGIVAVVAKRTHYQSANKFEELLPNRSFIILDNMSDPGNVGTMIRTAEWFGIKQVMLYGNCANEYNSKVVRATMGSIFRMRIVHINHTDSSFYYIKKYFHKLNIYAADVNVDASLSDICNYDDNAFGLIIGSEAHGISKEIAPLITHRFTIEGKGQAESLNAGVALGISLFHLCKDKKEKK